MHENSLPNILYRDVNITEHANSITHADYNMFVYINFMYDLSI